MYINLLHLPLFNFAYLFFLSFPLNIFVCFNCFIPHLAPCFHFVFWFMLKLVLFLTGKYHFLFPLFVGSVYCILVGLFWLCLWVYMYMCIFHYFNYYLPDLVTPIVWGSLLVFWFGVFVLILLNAVTNHLWNLCSSPEIKPWAFGVGALTPRP